MEEEKEVLKVLNQKVNVILKSSNKKTLKSVIQKFYKRIPLEKQSLAKRIEIIYSAWLNKLQNNSLSSSSSAFLKSNDSIFFSNNGNNSNDSNTIFNPICQNIIQSDVNLQSETVRSTHEKTNLSTSTNSRKELKEEDLLFELRKIFFDEIFNDEDRITFFKLLLE